MNFSQYCTVGSRRGIVRGTVNDAGQAWRPQSLEELSTAAITTSVGDLELWFADLDAFTPWLSSAADMALLAEDERQRAARMTAPPVREHFLLSRLLLRRVLGAYPSLLGRTLEFAVSAHGKPFLARPDHASAVDVPHFNLSHCRGAWLLGVSRKAAIGVDIERPRRIDNALRLATRVFTAAERAALLAAAESAADGLAGNEVFGNEIDRHEIGDNAARLTDRDRLFLCCWTRKEAVLKAMGSGFALPAADFEVSTSAMPLGVRLPEAAGTTATVDSLTLPMPGFAAWALLGTHDVPVPRLRWLKP